MKNRFLAAATGVLMFAPVTASAQCASYTAIATALEEEFGEVRVKSGQAPDGRVLEFFASARNDTWTLVASMPGRPSCLISSGRGVARILAG